LTQPNSNTTTLFVSTRRAIQPHVRALIESHSGQTLEYWRQFGHGLAELECRREAVHELVRELKSQPQPERRLRKPRSPDGLRTPAEAAAHLGCSVKTLKGHVASGALKYVIIGHGTKRTRRMFTDADLNQFVVDQTRKDIATCPSTSPHVRHTGTSTSKCEVIGFTARRNARRAAKPKK
jgi:hypothetical protein